MKKIFKLYNNSLTILFDDTTINRYVVEETGKSPVGVTTVLQTLNKPALMTWPLNEAIKSLREWLEAGQERGQKLTYQNVLDSLLPASKAYLVKGDSGKDIGTQVHSAIEVFLKGESPIVSPEAEKAFTAFVRWYKEQDIKPLAIERAIYSKKHNYAGTLDCLFKINGELVLCDFKTTNISRTAPLGVYPEYFLQLGAYNLAYREEKATRVDKIVGHNYADQFPTNLMVIRVGKEGKVNTLRASEIGLSISDCEAKFLDVLSMYKFLTPLSKVLTERK